MCRIALETVDEVSIAVRDISELNTLDLCFDHGFDMGFIELEKLLHNSDTVGIKNGFKGIVSRDVILFEELTRRHGLEFISRTDNIAVRIVADRAQEGRNKELAASAFTVKINIDKIIDIKLDLHPGTPVGNDPV